MKRTRIAPKYIPVEGKGGYMPAGSDRYPIHVVSVSADKKTFWFVGVDCRRIDKNGMSETQTWGEWEPIEEEPKQATLSVDGHYYTNGGKTKGSVVLPTGEYDRYSDPSF